MGMSLLITPCFFLSSLKGYEDKGNLHSVRDKTENQ